MHESANHIIDLYERHAPLWDRLRAHQFTSVIGSSVFIRLWVAWIGFACSFMPLSFYTSTLADG